MPGSAFCPWFDFLLLIVSFENIISSLESITFPKRGFICFEHLIFRLKNIHWSEKVNYLLRGYDFRQRINFVQEG